MKRAHRHLAAALCLLAACDHTVAPRVLDGLWERVTVPGGPPGFGFSVLFSTTAGEINGAGTWQGEALPGGIVSATGQIARGTVSVDLTFTQVINGVIQPNSFVEHFVGAFTSPDDLEGTASGGGLTGQLHMHRSSVRTIQSP